MIDLFRPFVSPAAAELVARTLTPDADGRVYVGEGARVQEFEQAFGQLVGSPVPPLALNSCTSALDLALHLRVDEAVGMTGVLDDAGQRVGDRGDDPVEQVRLAA